MELPVKPGKSNVAILYIATGRYIIFWKDFFKTCEMHFLQDSRKEYFVFTDVPAFEFSENERVHILFHQQQGWPYDTLMRFHVFDRVRERLQAFDYIFFFNANMLFVQPVMPEEFLPDGKTDDGLLAVLHPGYFNQAPAAFPYETKQTQSKAFMKNEEGKHYFMGGLNGGMKNAYLELIQMLKNNTQADLDNNIIAVWHDESQLNKYMATHNPRILSPAYGYPEGRKLPFTPKIIIRDKNKYGGHSFLRNQKQSLSERIKFYIKKAF